MKREEIINYLEKNNEPYYPHTLDRVLNFINFESKERLIQKSKQLEKENEELKKENGTLKFENHDLCEYIKVLKENEEKMKNCFNCKHLKYIGKRCYCEKGLKMYKRNCEKHELAE